MVKVFRDDDHATFLLYESGCFKTALNQTEIEDKPIIIRELRDGILYSSWAAILQLQQGLKNLNVLELMQSSPEMKNFFCYKPPNLTTGKFANIVVLLLHWSMNNSVEDLFQPTFSTYSLVREEDEAYSNFFDFLEECGSCE